MMTTSNSMSNEINKLANSDLITAKQTIDKEIEALRVMESELDYSLTKALDTMQSAKGRIILTGMGKSGHIAKKIAASLASTGTPSFFVHPAEASHGDLGMITEDDVIIAISNSGESKELIDILNYSKRFGIKLIAITKNPESSLGKAGDIVLKLPNNGEACPLGLAPTSSTTATLVLGDILTIAMIKRNGFSKEQFNQRHPGGKLGSVLQKVSDLMHKGDEMPLLPSDSGMQETLLEMTSKRLGCVGFTDTNGNLIGMLTDGDLRRCLSNDILSKKACDVMTKNPKVISPEAMASEAVKLMHDKKITNIFAVENGKPVGVIHIHDCLNSGVV
ncbi:MAG: KpsF/GutQ family sugar-phosphate isomerase [Candidatus Gastranaerophilaceae bacterium]|nr:KpsF/GutQ family sugar-phosphate isomerase [Candidatus Gastranaerophilaceae bacterium]